jgi:2-keto-3-deoxy-L-rhamnonate aldolase RhmA
MTPNARFRQQLTGGDRLLGCFVKTPHPTVVEVLGAGPLDFLVLDGEHAPFDRAAVDACLLAGRAVGCPVLVRVPDDTPATILNVLDCGAAGVVVPHVSSTEQAEILVAATRYGSGGRGFAATTRAGGYGALSMTDHLTHANEEVVLICQIEDRAGVEAAAEIAALDGVDGLFVGRADLAVSYDLPPGAEAVSDMCTDVLGLSGAATGLFCAPGEDMSRWLDAGASFVVAGSDHSFLLQGAKRLDAAQTH